MDLSQETIAILAQRYQTFTLNFFWQFQSDKTKFKSSTWFKNLSFLFKIGFYYVQINAKPFSDNF